MSTEAAPRAWPGVTAPADWAARVADELGGADVVVAARARAIRPWLLWTSVAAWILPALLLDGGTGNAASFPARLILLVILFRSDAVIAVSDRGLTVHRALHGNHRHYRHIPIEQSTELHEKSPLGVRRILRPVWRVGPRRYAFDSRSDSAALAAALEQLRAR